ncbi:MAG: class I SAM-dependent methyltransferase [Saprospiraceae bacterium]|nr:class I SAM-dependent methyltransferase [Saprospiraceae bacterium]
MESKYNQIGKGYNRTRQADPYLLSRLHFHLSTKVGEKYLDIGCGTGNYTIALNALGADLIGVDPSPRMLDIARSKNEAIPWILGSAESIPLEDNAVDGALATLTIHHWTDLHRGFQELYRVIKPGGRIVLFTSTPDQMNRYWLNHYFPKMLEDSMLQMPALSLVQESLETAGFHGLSTEPYFIQPDLQDLFLYSGKHNPSLYFESQVRAGISSFSALANAAEVTSGLAKLQDDIKSGHIDQVITDYQNTLGDYLFITARMGKKLSE